MRIFLFEFVTGGGTWTSDLPFSGSLLREGRAMISALSEDFARIKGVEIDVLRDARLPDLTLPAARATTVENGLQHQQYFALRASQADWTLVVAPEIGGLLLSYCRRVLRAGGRLLGPDLDFVEIGSDKSATHRLLQECGVPVPRQQLLPPGYTLPRSFDYPGVIKPRDGAGSVQVRLVRSHRDDGGESARADWRCLESFCRGLPVSVAVLGSPRGFRTMPACRQRFHERRAFRYAGGELPLEPSLATRAEQIARQVAHALPAAAGYFGIDLVLGDPPDGTADVAVEVNPRITTSYVGLRRLARGNLAEAMLACMTGHDYELLFASHRVEFSAE